MRVVYHHQALQSKAARELWSTVLLRHKSWYQRHHAHRVALLQRSQCRALERLQFDLNASALQTLPGSRRCVESDGGSW